MDLRQDVFRAAIAPALSDDDLRALELTSRRGRELARPALLERAEARTGVREVYALAAYTHFEELFGSSLAFSDLQTVFCFDSREVVKIAHQAGRIVPLTAVFAYAVERYGSIREWCRELNVLRHRRVKQQSSAEERRQQVESDGWVAQDYLRGDLLPCETTPSFRAYLSRFLQWGDASTSELRLVLVHAELSAPERRMKAICAMAGCSMEEAKKYGTPSAEELLQLGCQVRPGKHKPEVVEYSHRDFVNDFPTARLIALLNADERFSLPLLRSMLEASTIRRYIDGNESLTDAVNFVHQQLTARHNRYQEWTDGLELPGNVTPEAVEAFVCRNFVAAADDCEFLVALAQLYRTGRPEGGMRGGAERLARKLPEQTPE